MTTRRTHFLLLGALGLLAACSSLRTTTDYDRAVDFSRFHSYTFHLHTRGNELLEKRLERALTDTLNAKGLRLDDSNPDLWVEVHTSQGRQTVAAPGWGPYGYGWGWGWGWWGWRPWYSVPVGTVVVDLLSAHDKQLVWRGTATDVVDPQATPAEREREISDAVAGMFREFPPRASAARS
jgi:hypothetical protein